jgi:CRP-like cAMP-binding protein
MKHDLSTHPRRHFLRLQLAKHALLAGLEPPALAEIEQHVVLQDMHRGECLLEQGSHELCQFFVLEGLIKRIVTSSQGREMTLRFAGEGDFETCHDAWCRRDAVAFSVVCAAGGCVASVPMADWSACLVRYPQAREVFNDRMVALGQTLVEHAVDLLLLDAPSRVDAFLRRSPQLVGRLVQKDLASHLNLSAETLCRLSRRADPRLVKVP